MYKGFSSELFVPYMDPDENWYFKSYMDAGEFGLGATAMSLMPLNDCPRYAHYVDGVFVSSDGKPYVQPNMICVFERYAGDIGWRHSEIPVNGFEIKEARAKVTLVARMQHQDANGERTTYQNVYQIPNQEEMSSPLVSENVIGVVHDHFITYHLDMDIDDTNNTLVKVHLVKEETLPGIEILRIKTCVMVHHGIPSHSVPGGFPCNAIVSSSFDLKPVNFFESNPILRAAPFFEKDLPVCRPAASS
ncbi:hypothetical protein GH714_009431 [Hevea brasiliensis]|uniref:Amine oxidase n=1 Tax=Hevea brasiliensis TaxID=3981 RepID=A0A6A6MLA1_HEVBR|nr:hypothetical protein GH714_009431 [Hevea brasiliensis]